MTLLMFGGICLSIVSARKETDLFDETG